MTRLLPLLVLLLAACAAQPPAREAQPAAEELARSLMAEGDFAGAAEQYLALAARDARRRDHWRLRAAEAWREEGRLDRAAEALAEVQTRRLEGREVARADLLLAEIALDLGDADAALSLLAWPGTELPRRLQPRYHEIRARALEARRLPFAAARERARLDPLLEGFERDENRMAIEHLLRQVAPDALLAQFGELPADDPLEPLARQMLERAGLLARPREDWADFDPDDQGWRPPRRVALLLPASGPLAGAAQAVRDGFMTAYFADGRDRPQVRLYDSGATPEDALLAYRRAVADGAERVVGPLARDSVAGVFTAGIPPVPLLALNHAGGPVPWGSYEFGLLPDQEGRQLAERLLETGVRQVALVAVEEDFAERAARAFRSHFEAGGGRLLGEVRVAPGGTDYSEPLAQALDVALAERRRRQLQAALGLELRGEAVFRPDLEAALLIARSGFARLLVPQVRVYTAGELPLLATSHVFGGDLAPSADRDLDGLVFCDMAWLLGVETPLPPRAALGDLASLAGSSPRLFAFGMDAYRLLGYLDWLAADPGRRIPAASGELSIEPGGQVRRHLACARFVQGVPQPLVSAARER
jgi:outer membrane PBP1 activator LpoA protein